MGVLLQAEQAYSGFLKLLGSQYDSTKVKDGVFGAMMDVSLVNDVSLHSIIYSGEMSRGGLAGPGGSLTTGMAFGVPPLFKFGDAALQERFLPELLRGEKRSCIAITEPDAGSDVANITTVATKTPDGKHYIINGTKKWSVAPAPGHIPSPAFSPFPAPAGRPRATRSQADGRPGLPTASGPTTPPWRSGRGPRARGPPACPSWWCR